MLATARSAAQKTTNIERSGHGTGVTKTISPLVAWTEARCGEILRLEVQARKLQSLKEVRMKASSLMLTGTTGHIRLLQPRTIKNILNHKGWAYFAFVVTINEHKIRGDLKKSQDPTIREKLRSESQIRSSYPERDFS